MASCEGSIGHIFHQSTDWLINSSSGSAILAGYVLYDHLDKPRFLGAYLIIKNVT